MEKVFNPKSSGQAIFLKKYTQVTDNQMVTILLPLVYFSLPLSPPLRLFYLFYFAVYLFKFKIAECDLCRRVRQGVLTQPPSNPPRAKKLRLEITNFSEKLMG